MAGELITLQAEDGHDFGGYLARPDGAARGAVVVVQEIFGVNHHIRSVCDRYAAAGWTALAPALFDRVERGVELAYDQPGIDRGRAIMGQVSMDAALSDVGAALGHLGTPGSAAVVGFCWGGTLAWLAAARLPVRAAVGYYGGQIAKHVHLTLRAPVLLHFGEKDTAIPLSVSEEVRAARPEVMVHLYPAGHGFSCDERASYDADSARRAWTRTQGLLEAAF
ncbi:dienelactone hydrolase family protein [Azospirillum sp. TSO22-1]|uniref:dienelactone hydrolase family protein n=1 Tax=Azospirillum sp. TSO22-1 TaxID=716789 RepID=UPI000D605E23|nr:dienelactone hydrolase family protein [Azospirillum sp. TSO22-1]PWC56514.1 carboxymethylenebutenolidase [Azospirillum sp. TSO22-1]